MSSALEKNFSAEFIEKNLKIFFSPKFTKKTKKTFFCLKKGVIEGGIWHYFYRKIRHDFSLGFDV